MIAQRKRTWIVGLAVAAVLILFGAATYLQPHSVTADTPCQPDWALSSSHEVRDRCGEQKHLVSVQREQAERTAQAQQPYVQKWPGFVPQKLKKPQDILAPKDVPLINVATGPAAMRGATSVWFIDYVSDSEETLWSELYLISFGGDGNGPARIQTYVLNRFTPDMGQFEHLWTCPRALGTITITTVTGLNGIVAFTSSSGRTGSFNMATEQWAFAP
jgi:hypothetical protein